MRWSAGRAALAEAVRETRGDLSAKDDILAGHVLLRADGGRLTVIGRDTFMTVSATCAISGDVDGAVCVDHRRLDDFLHHVAGEDVKATLNSDRLRLRVGVATVELPTYGEDVLVIPKMHASETAVVETEAIARALGCVLPAAHEDVAHAVLCGVHVVFAPTGLVAQASDGKRFARAAERLETTSLAVTLNRRFASKLMSVAHRHRWLTLRHDESRVAAEIGTVRVFGQKLLAPFPSLTPALDGDPNSGCELDRATILAAIETIRAVGEDAPLQLQMLSGKLRLSVRSADGDAAIPLACEPTGDLGSRVVSLRNFRAACGALDIPRLSVSFVNSDVVRVSGTRGPASATWALVCRIS